MAMPVRVSRPNLPNPLDFMRRDLNDMISQFFGPGGDGGGWGRSYGVDIREDADHLYVEADLPGYSKENVDVTIENGTLTITAARRESPAEGQSEQDPAQPSPEPRPQGTYLLRERRFERYQRSFTLPSTVDEQNVQAKLEGGCLTITLNKTQESKPRRIAVT